VPGTPPAAPQPFFTGAGTSAEAAPIQSALVQCFCDPSAGNPTPHLPSAIAELLVEPTPGGDALHARLTINPAYADNTYGANAVGWPKGHKFMDLVGSDAAALGFHDQAGKPVLVFHLDYLSGEMMKMPGMMGTAGHFTTLGAAGGDGRMVTGDPTAILRSSTSMSLNLNQRGYGMYTVDSPHPGASYQPDPAAPAWDYRVVYEAWVKTSIFGGGTLGFLNVPYLHVSPSKTGINQTPLTPCGCPPSVGHTEPSPPITGTPTPPPPMCRYATCSDGQGSCPSGSSCVGTCCVPVIE
jgi:hypothetical protein